MNENLQENGPVHDIWQCNCVEIANFAVTCFFPAFLPYTATKRVHSSYLAFDTLDHVVQ